MTSQYNIDLEIQADNIREDLAEILYECYRLSDEAQFRCFLDDLRYLRRLIRDYREDLYKVVAYLPEDEDFTGNDIILGDRSI